MVNPYCISGAGSSQANGTYSYNSSIDTWQKVGNTSVYFNYDYDYDCFRLIDGNMGYYPLYAGTLYQTNPSLITWSTIYGTSPVPTITAGECEVVLVDPYCVSGAGDSIANGTYSFVNSSYNQFMSGYWQHTTEPNLRMGQGMMGSYEIYNEYTRLYYASSLTGTWTVEYGTASAPTVTAGACGATSAPTVTSISPDTGTTAGGTNITITGTNLTGATAVTIGGTAVTSFTVVSSTSITAATPAKTAGTASVLVTTPGGTNAANTLFTYSAPSVVPTVTSISPTSGTTAGGTSITITGTNFTGATGVTIGGTAATNVTVVSSTSITATTPSGTAGAKSVLVTTAEGTNTANTLFTFTAPSPTPSPTTSNIIKPRRSEVAGVIPLPSELQTHEMAVNLADKIIFVKKSDDTIVAINGSSGGGGSTLIVGVDVQGYDADLQAISEIASGTGLLKKTGTTWSLDSSAYLTSSSTIDAATLNAQLPSYYLNYTNLTNKPTIISSVSATTPIVANTVSGSTSLSIPAATTAAAGHMSAAQVTSLNSLSTSVSTLTASTVQSRFYASPSTVTGTPTFRSIVASDIPTLNQNTTGSSGSCTGNAATATSVPGMVSNATHTGDAEGATTLVVKKINGVALSGLATGILKNTTTTGVPSIAVAADFPILNQNTTGNAATATSVPGAVYNQTHTGDAEGSTALVVKKINGVALSGLSTGILKNTTTTGVPSIAIASDFPILNQNTTGNAATATVAASCSGNAANVTGIVAVANGGTGVTSKTGTGSVVLNVGATVSSIRESIINLTDTNNTNSMTALMNANLSNNFYLLLNKNVTSFGFNSLTLSNTEIIGVTLAIEYSNTPASITWASNISWVNSTPPVIAGSLNKKDVFCFITYNNGTNWLGFIAGQNI